MKTLSVKQTLLQGWNVFIHNILIVIVASIILTLLVVNPLVIFYPTLELFMFSIVVGGYVWFVWFLPQSLKLAHKQEPSFSKKDQQIKYSLSLFGISFLIMLYILFTVIIPIIWINSIFGVAFAIMFTGIDVGVELAIISLLLFFPLNFSQFLLAGYLLYAKNHYLLSLFMMAGEKGLKGAISKERKIIDGQHKNFFKLIISLAGIGLLISWLSFLLLPAGTGIGLLVAIYSRAIILSLFIVYVCITVACVQRILTTTHKTANASLGATS